MEKKTVATAVSAVPSEAEESRNTNPDNALTEQATSRDDNARLQGNDWWVWEFVGVLGSALAMAGMIGFLAAFNNKPVPDWSMPIKYSTKSVPITLNSILSILSTVSKICVLIPVTKGIGQLKWIWFTEKERSLNDMEKFESASRGLTGSAVLLWKLRFRHFAALGAMAMLISVAFDPFVQNLIKYTVEYRDVAAKFGPPEDRPAYAYMPYADTYATTENNTYGGGGRVDMSLRSSVQTALFDTAIQWDEPQYECSTGNCTFDPFITLGMCSQCSDISSMLQRQCDGAILTETGTTGCNISLPNGFSLNGPAGSYRNVFAMTSNNSFAPLVYTQDFVASQGFEAMTVIQSMFGWNASLYDLSREGFWPSGLIPGYFIADDSDMQARECMLYPCLQALYSQVFTDPLLKEEPTPQRYVTEKVLGEFPTHKFVPDDSDSGIGKMEFPAIGAEAVKALQTKAAEMVDKAPYVDSNNIQNAQSTFTMSTPIYAGLQSLMKDIFKGFATVAHLDSPGTPSGMWSFNDLGSNVSAFNGPELLNTELIFNKAYFADQQTSIVVCERYGPEFSPGSNGDLECVVRRVARAMTNAMRLRALSGGNGPVGSDGVQINGIAIMAIPWIKIQWYWLVVPIILWIMSFAVLIGTAIKTRQAGVRAWGTNSLPMVFLPMEEEHRKELEKNNLSEKGFARTAQGMKLRLKVEERDLRLVGRGA